MMLRNLLAGNLLRSFHNKCIQSVISNRSCTSEAHMGGLEEITPNIKTKNIALLENYEHNVLNKKPPRIDPLNENHHTLKFNCELYARFGANSGVDPGIVWPTEKDLEDMKEIDSLLYPESLSVMLRNAKIKRSQESLIIMEREKKMQNALRSLDQYKNQILEKKEKKIKEYYAQKAKKQKLIEEIRDYFGYDVSPKDPKFLEMLENKEKQERKLKKQKKKEEKHAQEMAKLLGSTKPE